MQKMTRYITKNLTKENMGNASTFNDTPQIKILAQNLEHSFA